MLSLKMRMTLWFTLMVLLMAAMAVSYTHLTLPTKA